MNTMSSVIFLVLVAVTVGVTIWAGRRNKSADDHYVAGGTISGKQNGIAIAGDYISAASFLGVTGAIALGGFNGFYLAVFVPVAYVLALLLVAEPLRNLGRFTLADVLATRFDGNHVRSVMAISTVVISVLYMVAQFVGAAVLVKLLFGIEYWQAVLIIGALTTFYTLIGGMLATTWIQIIKTALLLLCAGTLLVGVLIKFDFQPFAVFSEAYRSLGLDGVAPVRESTLASIDSLSLVIGLVFGVLGLPHVMIRFLTVRDARAARSSAITAIWIFSAFYLVVPFIAYGAAQLVGRDAIASANPAGNLALPQLAELLGGGLLLAIVSAVAFATILAVLSGLVIATTGAIAHDLYAQVLRKGNVSARSQFIVARFATFGVCVVATLVALGARDQNVAFLASLAIAVAASANLPALLLTIYWRAMTSIAVVSGMAAGLASATVMIALSPVLAGEAAVIGLTNPAIVSIPIGFLVSVVTALATARRSRTPEAERAFTAMRHKALTGRQAPHLDDGGAHRAGPAGSAGPASR